ncbi:hypothetical protein HD806DRAFT_524481 [Xylariaceae sp. AK1471]|nr:hypothetical protein HD806DRAFT_524481 [Xylariaceae sp. AK1471]
MFEANPLPSATLRNLVLDLDKKKAITKDSRFLDMGSGNGACTLAFRNLHPDVPIFAADFAPGMIDILKEQNIPGVTAAVADATNIDRNIIPKGDFSHMALSFMIQFCGAKQMDALKEAYDTVEAGGAVAVGIGMESGHEALQCPFDLACEALEPQYQRVNPHLEEAWMESKQVEDGMKAVGFTNISSTRSFIALNFASPEDYLHYFWNGKHPGLQRGIDSWKGDMNEVKLMMYKVLLEQYPNPPKLGAWAGITVGLKPK